MPMVVWNWYNWLYLFHEIILVVGSANERWHYIVTLSLIAWTHTQKIPDYYILLSYPQIDAW